MGVGGNFDPVQRIVDGKIAATGPLVQTPGESHLDLLVWIAQHNLDGTGAFAFSSQDTAGLRVDPEQWSTPPAPPQYGTFQDGPATAMAVLISTRKSDGATTTFWWAESVIVKNEAPAAP